MVKKTTDTKKKSNAVSAPAAAPTSTEAPSPPVSALEKPKKPPTGYLLFNKAHRDQVKKENPEAKSSMITVKLAEKWNLASDEEKKPFHEEAEKEKARYNEENAAYNLANAKSVPPESAAADDDNKKKKGKKSKDTSLPKRNISAYIFFCNHIRSSVKEELMAADDEKDPKACNSTRIMTEMAKRWREISEEDKAPFVKMAGEDKERYDAELAKMESSEAVADAA
jgi:high mobility group protein B2